MSWMPLPPAYLPCLNWSERDVNPELDRFTPSPFSSELSRAHARVRLAYPHQQTTPGR